MSAIQEKLAAAYWRVKSLRIKQDPFVLPETLIDPRSILVVMPFDSREFEMANEALIEIDDHFPRTKIAVCLNETFRTWIPKMLIPRSIAVNTSDFNVFHWPKKSLIRKVQALNCDVAIDLNAELHLGYAILCALSGAGIRVALDKPYSSTFFNFVVRSDVSHKLRHRYDALVKYLIPSSMMLRHTPNES
jgi:ADP-heptose:LPS heptosyltransferase